MKYLSVCSGIEAATVAWHSLGWTPTAFSEIEKFPSQVLAHHYPNVPNVGDMTKYKEWNFEQPINLLVGGTPCQSFSVAGLRKGLEDPRGNLALTYCGILDHFRPKWFVWENVPGVLSSGSGRDFGSFLGALAELGYGFAYRVLDAQYFRVAQRRRRVFVVGCAGDWRSAAKVLFESESLRRNSAPSRKEGKGFARVAGTLTSNGGGLNRPAGNANELDFCIPTVKPIALAENTIGRLPKNGGNGDGYTEGGPMYTLNATGVHGVAQPIGTDIYNASITGDVASTLTKRSDGTGTDPTVMQPMSAAFKYTMGAKAHGIGYAEEQSPTLDTKADSNAVLTQSMAVRRLTPTECERLQGFPDNYTDIKPNGKATPDGPRYKALGNSMAVPVMAWIGKRIQEVENS